MTDTKHDGLPVSGYRPQSQEAVDLVNGFKNHEERLLRVLDDLQEMVGPRVGPGLRIDGRWLAIGRTQLEQAFMAINRSVFQPSRFRTPDDVVADSVAETK